MDRVNIAFACLVCVLGGCTDGGGRGQPAPQPAEDGDAPVQIVVRPPPLTVQLIAIAAERTDRGGLRWTGRARIEGYGDSSYHALVKTTCVVDGVALTDVTSAAIDDTHGSSLGRVYEGKEFDFTTIGARGLADDARMCQMSIALRDRMTSALEPTVSWHACFPGGTSYVGACQPRLPKREARFQLADLALNPAQSLRATYALTVGEQMHRDEVVMLKASCLQGDESDFSEVLVGADHGTSKWGFLKAGETSHETAQLPYAVLARASACRLTVRRVRPAARGDLSSPPELAQNIGEGCWSRSGDPDACAAIPRPVPQTLPPFELGTAVMQWQAPGTPNNLEAQVAIVVNQPQRLTGRIEMRAECAGRETMIRADLTTPPAALEPGEAVVASADFYELGSRDCRIILEHHHDDRTDPLGTLCVGPLGPTTCASPASVSSDTF